MPKTVEVPCSDYFPGDILLKRKPNPDHWMYTFIIQGQQLPGNNNNDPHFVHAGIVGAYGPPDKIPLTYEVSGGGIHSSQDHPGSPDYQDMSSETWVRYRWVTDFDESFAQILREGNSQVFLEETVQPLLKLVPNPFKLNEDVAATVNAHLIDLALHPAINDALRQHLRYDGDGRPIYDGHRLRQFIKACAVFALREQVAEWGKVLYEAKKVSYDHWGAFLSVLGPRFRQREVTEEQLNALMQQSIKDSATTGSTYFCSQFVVHLWTSAPLDLLPKHMTYHEKKYFLPLKMNLEAANPADLHVHFRQNPLDWKTVLGVEELYRVHLLKRILRTALIQTKRPIHPDKIKRLEQCQLWYELQNYIGQALQETTSWTKGSAGRLILEALQPWHPAQQTFSFPFISKSQGSLVETILKSLPDDPYLLAKRIFPDDTLALCHTYQALLNEAEKSRASNIYTVETIESGYVKPLSSFLEWMAQIIESEPNAMLVGIHRLFQSANEYMAKLIANNLSSEEREALIFVEKALLVPLASSWQAFWDLLSPGNIALQINHWGQFLLKRFLAYRRTVYDPTAAHPLMTLLADYPDETGWTVQAQQKTFRREEKLQALLTIKNTESDYLVETVREGKIQRYFLKRAIGEGLFNTSSATSLVTALSTNNLEKNKRYVNERHIFYRQNEVLLKVQRQPTETLFGDELVVHQFHDALGLNVLPSSTLWRIEVRKGPCQGAYYCWVSEFMEGELLDHVMKNNPEKLTQLSLQSVSELYVLTLVTSQEDGNPFNMSLLPDYRLCAFDVGHAFTLPLMQSRWTKTELLELKSMVFLLPQMSFPLAISIQEKLTLLNLSAWMEAQKHELKQLTQGWKQLLAKEKAQPVPLLELTETPWAWIEFILTGLQSRLQKNSALTHAALFHKLLPLVASRYHEKRLSLTFPEAYRRFKFKELNERAYKEIIVRSPQGDIHTLTTSRMPKAIREMQQQGNAKYQQLLSLVKQDSVNMSGDFYKAAKIKRQAFVLLQALHAKGIKEIDLSRNSIVQDEHIVTFLQQLPGLEKLSISHCRQLTGKGWLNPKLFRSHPQLKLDISGSHLEESILWNSAERCQHVLSWTKPRAIFLEQFKQWEESGWKLLEKQPFNLSLTEPEEDFLIKNMRRYKAALNITDLRDYNSLAEFLTQGQIWVKHPLLRYRFFFTMFNFLFGVTIPFQDYLNKLSKEFYPHKKLFLNYTAKIIVAGGLDSNKHQLLTSYVSHINTADKPIIGLDIYSKTVKLSENGNVLIRFWALAETGRFERMNPLYCREADGAIIISSLTEGDLSKASEWKRDILCVNKHPIPFILFTQPSPWVDIEDSDKFQMDRICQDNEFIGWRHVSARTPATLAEGVHYLISKILENDGLKASYGSSFGVFCDYLLELYDYSVLCKDHYREKIINNVRNLYNINAGFFKEFSFGQFVDSPDFQQAVLCLMKEVSFEKIDLTGCNELRDLDIFQLIVSSPQLHSLAFSASDKILGNFWIEFLMGKESFKELIVDNLSEAPEAFIKKYQIFNKKAEKLKANQLKSTPEEIIMTFPQAERPAIEKEKSTPQRAKNFPAVFEGETQEKYPKILDDLSIVKKHGNRFFITSQNNDKNILKSRPPRKIITLGNGNCLFNTVALGLCDLIMKNQLPVLPESFFAMTMRNDKLLFRDGLGFKEWITNHNFEQKQEKLSLPLLLRRLAIQYIETHYESYHNQFEDILRELYRQQKNEEHSPDENHFLEHGFIGKQIDIFAETEDGFIDWWQREGKSEYFAAMKDPAADSQDKKRWGGEIELDAIALYLGIRIVYHKKPAGGRPLGILGEVVPILREGEEREGIFFTEGEKELLNNLGLGDQRGHCFHLEKEFFAKLDSYQSLSEKSKALLHWFMNNDVLNIPATVKELKEIAQEEIVFTKQEYKEFLSCLQTRGIIKQTDDKNFRLITEDSAGKILDKERILEKMGDISEELRVKLALLSQNKVPEFEVVFGDDHWEYLPSQANVSFDEPYKESNIVSVRRQSF